MRTIGVAIPIPEPWGGELQRWRRSFGDPQADAIPTHVTLLPPTEVDPEVLPAVERHLSSVASSVPAFRMRLRGTATFRPVSPVVFVAVAEGISFCEQLSASVRSGPLAQELRFNYHPHVTVAHELADDVLDKAFEELADFEAAFDVPAFRLYEHDGVWRPQRDFTLGCSSVTC